MVKYIQKVKDLAFSFTTLNVLQILRSKNTRADLLLKLMETLEHLSIEEAPVMQNDHEELD